MKAAGRTIRECIACKRGNFLISVALLIPILAGLAGGTVDFFLYTSQKGRLQEAADSAALAAAHELSLAGWTKATAEAVVDAYIAANLDDAQAGQAAYRSHVDVDPDKRRVSVTVDEDGYRYFIAGYLRHDPQIRVRAVAQASGETNICVIGLDSFLSTTVELREEADLFSPDCAVYSNSTDSQGLRSQDAAELTAALACSAGGYAGAPHNFDTPPVTDCPVAADPLADRASPPIPPCAPASVTDGLAKKDTVDLDPDWAYCGGLTIRDDQTATFAPGVYVFKNGPLIVRDNAVVEGLDGVGLYFTGDNAYFSFTANARVDLEAPDHGPMAGLLMFQDRNGPVQDFKITSDFTRHLVGTIYLPKGNFIVDAMNDVADESAYTAIVVRQLILRRSPNLVLNTDYDDTDVPVPAGLGPRAGQLRLIR